MKKIKKFYKEHRVFTILMSVVIVCLILIITVLVQIFYFGNGNDKYGDRLEGIENVPITESREDDFEKNIVNEGKAKKCDLIVTGRIIYITIQFNEDVDLETAKSVALKSLESFSEEELAFYDFNFTLKKNTSDKVEGFLISGARTKNGSGLVWNNNRQVTEEPVDDNSTEKDE